VEFYEAIDSLYKLNNKCRYECLECGLTTKMEWAIWRHIDTKHSDRLYKLSGQAHGWNNARMGWKD